MLFNATEHASNSPDTWKVVKRGRGPGWAVTTKGGAVLDLAPSKRIAVERTQSGFLVELYEKERRWYAGEAVEGWKPYKP